MVPFLYVVYGRLGLDPSDGTTLAHATSLAVIIPTALRGLQRFRGSGLVQWRAALPLALVAGVSAAVTAPFAAQLPGQSLRVAFGAFLVLLSLDLLVLRGATVEVIPEAKKRHIVAAALMGLPVGALSAALGIGGGVPAGAGMHYLLKLPFRVIAATSLVVILVTAIAGTASYLFVPSILSSSHWVVGHVDFEHGLPLAIGAVAAAPLGVSYNKRAPVLVLRRIFGVLLLVVGALLLIRNA